MYTSDDQKVADTKPSINTAIPHIAKALGACRDQADEDGYIPLDIVGEVLRKEFFDPKKYGYNKLHLLIEQLDIRFEIVKRGPSQKTYIRSRNHHH